MRKPHALSLWSLIYILIVWFSSYATPLLAHTEEECLTAESAPREECPPVETDILDAPGIDIVFKSNTGYIDSAFVLNQLRVRYDWNFDADRPDRAEFIYAKCTPCNPGGISPGPADDLDYQEFELTFEHAFSNRFSLFTEIPVRSIDLTPPPGSPIGNFSSSGIGDVRVGFKYATLVRPDRYLTLQVRGYFPSGDAEQALGTDHYSIEPALLYYKKLKGRWSMESELRWWHPIGGTDFAGDVLRFGIGASHEGRGSDVSFSPVAELVGWYVLDGFKTAPPRQDASGDTIVNLKLGARIRASGLPGSLYLGYGVALTNDIWYDSVFRIEYRHAFGR